MYEQFYRFADKPFGLTLDPRFLYESESHASAMTELRDAIDARACFAAVFGDVGTGKSTLCRALADGADKRTIVALLRHPPASPEDLLIDVLQMFGVASFASGPEPPLPDRDDLRNALRGFLDALSNLDATAVLVVDEAQLLSETVLEELRILVNLKTRPRPVLQLVLVGQPSLRTTLRSPALQRLDLRLNVRVHLRPMTDNETTAYVAHRLAVAGGAGQVTFTPGALQAVHRHSRGIPRLVNLLCNRTLLAGHTAQTHTIDADLVHVAAAELELKKGEPGATGSWWRRLRRRA